MKIQLKRVICHLTPANMPKPANICCSTRSKEESNSKLISYRPISGKNAKQYNWVTMKVSHTCMMDNWVWPFIQTLIQWHYIIYAFIFSFPLVCNHSQCIYNETPYHNILPWQNLLSISHCALSKTRPWKKIQVAKNTMYMVLNFSNWFNFHPLYLFRIEQP